MSRNFDIMRSVTSPPSVPRGTSEPGTRNLQTSSGPSAHAGEESLAAAVLRVMRKRKWTIALFTLIVLAIVTGASLLMRPEYDAVSRVVFYRENQEHVLGFDPNASSDAALGDAPDDHSALDTQIGILQSDALALQVIHDLHLQNDPQFAGRSAQAGDEESLLKTFHRRLDVSKIKGMRLIQIRFRSTNPKMAAEVVNDLAKEYVEQNYKSKFSSSMQISKWLAGQLADLQAKVEDSQRKLVDYQKANDLVGVGDSKNIVTARLDDLNKELTNAQAERIQKEASYRLARSGQPEVVAKLEQDSLINKLNAQRVDLQTQLAKLSTQFGPLHPKIRELQSQIAQLQQALKTENGRIAERLSNEYEVASRRERMLSAAVDQQKQSANELNSKAIQYDILKRDYESNREVYDGLLEKLKQAGVSASLKSTNIRIIDPAREPRKPSSPSLPLNLGAALVLGFTGGLLLSFLMEKSNQRVSTPEQVQVLSPLPSLGIVPLLQGNGTERILPQLTTSSTRFIAGARESYKAVLTSLLLSSQVPPKILLVTSPLPNEGKTTVSVNSAIVLAQQKKRVLLVDTDLRKSGVASALHLSAGLGLNAVLQRSANFEEAVIACRDVPHLYVLPAGRVETPDQIELLASDFQGLLMYWRERFDHIIIDTPPVLRTTDALALSVHADAVLLVIRSGQTTKDAFLHSQALLHQVHANMAGVVVNGADLSSSEFSRYKDYAYGYSSIRRNGASAA